MGGGRQAELSGQTQTLPPDPIQAQQSKLPAQAFTAPLPSDPGRFQEKEPRGVEGNPLPKLETEPACVSTAAASWGWRKQGCTAKGMGAWAVAKDYLGGLVPREPEGVERYPQEARKGMNLAYSL